MLDIISATGGAEAVEVVEVAAPEFGTGGAGRAPAAWSAASTAASTAMRVAVAVGSTM